MNYRQGQPEFNTGGKNIVNFTNFIQNSGEEEHELEKVKRSFRKNDLSIGKSEEKMFFNRLTNKWDTLSKDMVKDKLAALKESKMESGVVLRSLLDAELSKATRELDLSDRKQRNDLISIIEDRLVQSDWIELANGVTFTKTFDPSVHNENVGTQGQYKSDDEIESEFEGMTLISHTAMGTKEHVYPKSVIEVQVEWGFPEGGESVGGGSDVVVEYFLVDTESGDYEYQVDHWYPTETYEMMKKEIEKVITEDYGIKTPNYLDSRQFNDKHWKGRS